MVELQTERLTLRELKQSDFDAIHEYATDPETVQFAQKEHGMTRFKATCDAKNEASRKVIEKCGLKLVKRIDKDTLVFDSEGH